MTTRDKAVYLYCLACAGTLDTLGGPGLEPQQPLLLAAVDDIVAVYSVVDLADFTGPEAEANLQDIHWIGPRALAHEQVVTRVAGFSPVLPVRFGTLFSSLAGMQRQLTAKHDEVAQFLERIADRQEWSLKGYVDKKQAIKRQFEAEVAARSDELDPLAPGVRYLREKKLEEAAQKTVAARLQEQLAALGETLAPLLDERAERKILTREATGRETDMVLNWALLVEQAHVAGLTEAIRQINRQLAATSLVLELSGPWPPYSFCPTLSPDCDA